MCARRRSGPTRVSSWYRGMPYVFDLDRCRHAFVERQVQGGFSSVEGLARAVGVSRSTASRFFAGRAISLATVLGILMALHLTFEEVARPADDANDGDGEAGVESGSRRPREDG
jgi:hypothetical protein